MGLIERLEHPNDTTNRFFGYRHKDGRPSFARSLSGIVQLDRFTVWLRGEILGEAAGPWLDEVIDKHIIACSQQLIDLLAVKWPGLISGEGRRSVMNWMSKIVCEDFLLEASPQLFPSLVYQTLLDRPPSPTETKEAADIGASCDAIGRRKLLEHITLSEEYRRSSKRRTLLQANAIGDFQFELRRNEYQTIGYQVPQLVPAKVFDLGQNAELQPLKGFVCAKYDAAGDRVVIDPNVSIIGKAIGGNRFEVGPEWLVIGPRVSLDAGDYIVVIDVCFEGTGEVLVDLVSDFGTTKLMALTFREQLKSVIPVKLSAKKSSVELRLFNVGGAQDIMRLSDLSIYILEPHRHLPPQITPVTPTGGAQLRREVAPTDLTKSSRIGRVAHLFDFWGRKDIFKATYRFVSATKEFDADWYLRQYEDVRGAGISPLRHFLHHGMSEGRLPNANFDLIDYLQRHPERSTVGSAFIDYLKEQHPRLAKWYFL